MNKVILGHLFADEMNIYGDIGNARAIEYRTRKRGLDYEYRIISKDSLSKIKTCNLLLFGGGQDEEQFKLFDEIDSNLIKDLLLERLNQKIPGLFICGGYQMLGKYFLDSSNRQIKGLGIFPIITKALPNGVKDRCIGNISISNNLGLKPDLFVGFENHGGQTEYCEDNLMPLGQVISGFGNNFTSKQEGLILNNFIGTYMHGPLLPKNPQLTDWLIKKALGHDISAMDMSLELGNISDI